MEGREDGARPPRAGEPGRVDACGGVGEKSGSGAAMGLVGLAMVLLYLFVLKHRYWVVIGTAGAERPAIWSYDLSWTARVVAAVNEAMIDRG